MFKYSIINNRFVSIFNKYTEKDIRDYLEEQKKRYTIVEFSVKENGTIG